MPRTPRRSVLRGLVMFLSMLMLSVSLTACDPPGKPVLSDMPLYQEGTPVTLRSEGSVTEVRVLSVKETTDSLGKKAYPDAPTRGRFIVLDVEWKAMKVTKGRTLASSVSLHAVDSDSERGKRTMWIDNEFKTTELKQGESARGLIAFDVAESGPVDITFHDIYIREIARIKVDPKPR